MLVLAGGDYSDDIICDGFDLMPVWKVPVFVLRQYQCQCWFSRNARAECVFAGADMMLARTMLFIVPTGDISTCIGIIPACAD